MVQLYTLYIITPKLRWRGPLGYGWWTLQQGLKKSLHKQCHTLLTIIIITIIIILLLFYLPISHYSTVRSTHLHFSRQKSKKRSVWSKPVYQSVFHCKNFCVTAMTTNTGLTLFCFTFLILTLSFRHYYFHIVLWIRSLPTSPSLYADLHSLLNFQDTPQLASVNTVNYCRQQSRNVSTSDSFAFSTKHK